MQGTSEDQDAIWYIAPHKEAYELTMTLDKETFIEAMQNTFPGERSIFYCYESNPGTFTGSVVKLEPKAEG